MHLDAALRDVPSRPQLFSPIGGRHHSSRHCRGQAQAAMDNTAARSTRRAVRLAVCSLRKDAEQLFGPEQVEPAQQTMHSHHGLNRTETAAPQTRATARHHRMHAHASSADRVSSRPGIFKFGSVRFWMRSCKAALTSGKKVSQGSC